MSKDLSLQLSAETFEEHGAPAVERAIDSLRRLLQDGAGQRGLITDETLSAPAGETSSSADPAFMKRVVLALCDLNHEVQEDGAKRPASVFERLQRVGCPVELYHEMVENPEFLGLLDRTSTSLIVFGQIPTIKASLSAKAALGDEKAARLLVDLLRILDIQGKDEFRRQYAAMDHEAMLRLMWEEAQRTIKWIREYRGEDVEGSKLPDIAPPERPDTSPIVIDQDAFGC